MAGEMPQPWWAASAEARWIGSGGRHKLGRTGGGGDNAREVGRRVDSDGCGRKWSTISPQLVVSAPYDGSVPTIWHLAHAHDNSSEIGRPQVGRPVRLVSVRAL